MDNHKVTFRRLILLAYFMGLNLGACSALPSIETPIIAPTANLPSATPASATIATITPTATPIPLVPPFEHIIIVVFENKEFGKVVDNPQMPYFNQLANSYTLLTQYYAVSHPSLPNYLAMISGDTFGVTFDCVKCLQDAVTLPDLIESRGLTWKTYQEDMPSPCYPEPEAGQYAIKHNPFAYFKAIRLDPTRCARSIVPYTQLPRDLTSGAFPNYAFITPNLCNDAHDCPVSVADGWLQGLIGELQPALEGEGKPYLIVVTWDEGQGNHSCCGLPADAGGRVATILISPQVKKGYQDATPYTHYSLLKTIAEAWNLPYPGHAADPENSLIVAPWK